MDTAYQKIQVSDKIELKVTNGELMQGIVQRKDSEWLTIRDPRSDYLWNIAKSQIVAFRINGA